MAGLPWSETESEGHGAGDGLGSPGLGRDRHGARGQGRGLPHTQARPATRLRSTSGRTSRRRLSASTSYAARRLPAGVPDQGRVGAQAGGHRRLRARRSRTSRRTPTSWSRPRSAGTSPQQEGRHRPAPVLHGRLPQRPLWAVDQRRRPLLLRQARRERGTLSFEEIIEIPAAGQTEADAQRPKRKDLKPATGDNLLFAFRRCHNYIAGTEGKQKPEAFWELLKLIFCKIEDERSRSTRLLRHRHRARPTPPPQPRQGAHQKLFDRQGRRQVPARSSPRRTPPIDLKPNVVAYVVSQLQGFSLLAQPGRRQGRRLRGDRRHQPARRPRRVLHPAQRLPHGRRHAQPAARTSGCSTQRAAPAGSSSPR